MSSPEFTSVPLRLRGTSLTRSTPTGAIRNAGRRGPGRLSPGLYRRATGPGRLGVRAVLARPICGVPDGGSAGSLPSQSASL
jgi:hypothetical protein